LKIEKSSYFNLLQLKNDAGKGVVTFCYTISIIIIDLYLSAKSLNFDL